MRLAGNTLFLLTQIVFVSAVTAAAVWRTSEIEREHALPEPRREPLRVWPQYDEPAVVTDDQLQRALHKLEPRLRGEKPKINHVDHALRFWGAEAEFDDPRCLSGRELRDVLLDHRRFAKAWPGAAQPLLSRDAQGVAVRTQEGAATASHVDHTLAGLAEVGTPLDLPLRTAEGTATVRELLLRSLRTFSLDQGEYEWSALAYALYLPPEPRFYTRDGQEITFDRLAERLMREPLGRGVCAGHHRLHSLVMLLRVDEQEMILSPDVRERVIGHLRHATALLVQHQHSQGYWETNWPAQPAGDERADKQGRDLLSGRILATGHALEWWALAPREVHPPRETLVRAGQWLVRIVDELDEKQIGDNYTFLSHAGRALALWRGRLPAELLTQDAEAQRRATRAPQPAL
jgi:hypothetical protein